MKSTKGATDGSYDIGFKNSFFANNDEFRSCRWNRDSKITHPAYDLIDRVKYSRHFLLGRREEGNIFRFANVYLTRKLFGR